MRERESGRGERNIDQNLKSFNLFVVESEMNEAMLSKQFYADILLYGQNCWRTAGNNSTGLERNVVTIFSSVKEPLLETWLA